MLSRSNTISEGTEFKLVVVDDDDDKTGLILQTDECCRPRLQKATVPKSVDRNARERSIEQFMVIVLMFFWKKSGASLVGWACHGHGAEVEEWMVVV